METATSTIGPDPPWQSAGGPPRPHRIRGIGAGFIPEVLEASLVDEIGRDEIVRVEIVRIDNDIAVTHACDGARLAGLSVGISSGVVLAAALQPGV